MSSVNTAEVNPGMAPETRARHRRYRSIMESIVALTEFTARDVRKACTDEQPAFVTRVLGELSSDGWLIQESAQTSGSRSGTTYRWNRARGEFCPSRWVDERVLGSQIRESPQEERPRERLIAEGAEALTVSDLLAILIRSGRPGESAVMAGRKLARAFDGRLQDLPDAGRTELKSISVAVQQTAWCQIMAGIELGRRVAAATTRSAVTRITSTTQAVEFCREHFHRLATGARQEEFHIVTLDTKNQVMGSHQITVGTLDASLVHPREVFRPAIRDSAASVILVHNHPSGDTTPSREDYAVTRRLESSGELLGIEVLDHIIVGRTQTTSIREHMRHHPGQT